MQFPLGVIMYIHHKELEWCQAEGFHSDPGVHENI
jgi:hypothetical protein